MEYYLLGFITPNFLPICVMTMAVLSIFQAWIWMRVGIGRFLNDLGVKTFLTQNYMVWEHAYVWLAVCFIALL